MKMLMDKIFGKTIWKTLVGNLGRFFANFVIVAITLIVAGGLGELPTSYRTSYLDNYSGRKVPDLIVKSETGTFSDEQKSALQGISGVNAYEEISVIDLKQLDESYTRLYVYDLNSSPIGNITMTDGAAPADTSGIYAATSFVNIRHYDLGKTAYISYRQFLLDNIDSILAQYSLPEEVTDLLNRLIGSLNETAYNVTAHMDDTLYNSAQKERAYVEGDEELYINRMFYLNRSTLAEAGIPSITIEELLTNPSEVINGLINYLLGSLPATDIYLRFNTDLEYFSDEYKAFMDEKIALVKAAIGEDTAAILSLEENTSYALFKNYNEKITRIVTVIPYVFVLVALLMGALTISRLIKEERPQIACFLSLGVSRWKITTKYLIFTLLSTGLGGLLGYFIGTPLLPTVILPAYSQTFQMGKLPINFFNFQALIVLGICLLAGVALTLYQCARYMHKRPASLFQEEAPKPGKKILLERIPFLWKLFPFRLKSSLRNIFRQWKNTLLTILSMSLSTILIFFGFALSDAANAMSSDSIYRNIASSMGVISTLIVVLALALGITVTYSLANMNVEDRHREIATLKVLGYHNKECSMYTSREIIIISIFSSLIALPGAAAFIAWIFDYLEFGNIKDVTPLTYILSFVIVIALTFIVNALLSRRIKAIDMNASLKSIE